MTPGAVFDCMVFIQALSNAKGPACACYDLVRGGRLTDETVEAFLRDVLGRAEMLSEVPAAFRLDRDPKDERYIDLAVACGASYLVTWDRDLLDLMDDEEFGRLFPGLTILEPPALLRLLPQDPTETGPA